MAKNARLDVPLLYALNARARVPTEQERADQEYHDHWRRRQLALDMDGKDMSPLADWILNSDAWLDVSRFEGTHNQPPVSGEIEVPDVPAEV